MLSLNFRIWAFFSEVNKPGKTVKNTKSWLTWQGYSNSKSAGKAKNEGYITPFNSSIGIMSSNCTDYESIIWIVNDNNESFNTEVKWLAINIFIKTFLSGRM